ncbi:HTH-type transcriptional regulator DegA [Abditibacteriota bacterium]|nr:HTH-type transcriptional regulator DegA [Abditibacteriota bacterium]
MPDIPQSLPFSRADETEVLRVLNDFCGEQGPGAIVPSHTEWMQRLNATERSVRWALDELQRQGKIVRRRGARTLVSDGYSLSDGQGSDQSAPVNIGTRTVVVMARPDRSFFDRGVELLFKRTQEAALSFVFRPFAPGLDDVPQQENPLGYLLMGPNLLPLAVKLREQKKRVVLLSTPSQGTTLQVPHVQGDQDQGGYLATRHLIELGHRRLSFWGSASLVQTQRWAGHERAVWEARRQGMEINAPPLEIQLEMQHEVWRREPHLVEEYFARPTAPTAILVWNDREAIFLLSLLAHLGIRVPQQISVVGYDNLPESEWLHPALTTVDGGLELQLQAALDVLTSSVPLASDHTIIVPPHLVCRDSSVPPPST